MKKRYYQKLIRDRIPEIIQDNGGQYEVKPLDVKDFEHALKNKLIEESKEVMTASKESMIKELADVLEVIKSLAAFHDLPFTTVEKQQRQQRRERGGFKKRLFLEWASKD